jgi:beta-1,2-mannobiose phosphorylase / 1,2-beta-oligomannan phosphorylase
MTTPDPLSRISSYSPDLCYWGQSQLIMKPEPYHWDEMKIGPGAPPIKTLRFYTAPEGNLPIM